MEYRNLVTFLRVAELQNFTQAANSLGYAQSTVTFHIQSLEEELGMPLFDRIGKKVSLTMAGEYLITYANEMLHLESSIRSLNTELDQLPGTLRVGSVESLLVTYARMAIPRFCERYPRISLEVHTTASVDLMDLLRSNDVDLIIIMAKRIVDANFVRDLIYPAEMSFVTYAENPLAGREKLDFREIMDHPLILPEKTGLYRKAAEEIAARYDCILEPAVQINNTGMILDLLKQKTGISFLPDYLTKKEREKGTLVRLNVDTDFRQEYFIQILHHKNKWVTPQMKGFVSMMKELLEE